MKIKITKTLCKILIKNCELSTIRPLTIRNCLTKSNQRSMNWYQDLKKRKRRFFQTLKMLTTPMWHMKTSKACQSGAKAPPLDLNRSHQIQMAQSIKTVKLSPSKHLMALTLTFSTQRKRSHFPCLVKPPFQMTKSIKMGKIPPRMSII